MGCFYGISVGPGSAQLLTLEAISQLGKLDILYAPQGKAGLESFALRIAKTHLPVDLIVKERHFPMVYQKDVRNQAIDEIAKEIEEDVKAGLEVGFITLGDSMIYSTYQYLLERLQEKVPTKTLAGIPSFIQIASQIQRALTIDTEILTVLPATTQLDKISQAIDLSDTVVLMKVSGYMKPLMELLEKKGLDKECVLVSNASLEECLIQKGLAQMSTEEKYSYYTTMIIFKNR